MEDRRKSKPSEQKPRRVERAGTDRREGTSDPDRLGGNGAATGGVGTEKGKKVTGFGVPEGEESDD